MGSYETKHMAVRNEIKSQLARLLATEDLIVEHKKVQTASFDVSRRLLILPMWEKASDNVYDLLVGHEVGHALFTPDEDPPKGIPHQFINVTEDARIEKLIKRKYLGLAKTFFKGYRELNDDDFFQIEEYDIDEMNLADRANLYFKVGNFVDISFTEEEQEIINQIRDAETFADACAAAKVLYDYCKKPKEDQESPTPVPPQSSSNGQSNNEETQSESQTEDGEEEQKDKTPNGSDNAIDSDDEPTVNTMESFEDNLQDLIEEDTWENDYLEFPVVNLETVIASNKEVHQEIDSCWKYQSLAKGPEIYKAADDEFAKFKKSAQKEVNYLVKEFECKKAADSYARASTARTGMLDMSSLHTYKFNEDIFKKVTVVPEGKNHGLVFVLDWSGSMQYLLEDTLKQLFNLVWFCKKVGIPFDVYAFTNEWRRRSINYKNGNTIFPDTTPHYEREVGLLAVDADFNMMNVLTSKVSAPETDRQMLNLWRIAYYYTRQYKLDYTNPLRLSLSGTPLNEAFVCLRQILPKFQKENKVQKVQCVVLTDGEANHLSRHVEVKRYWESEPYIGHRQLNVNCFIRDRKLGTTARVPRGFAEFGDLMLNNLKQNFPSVNFIGIRVLAPRDANSFIRRYYEQGTDEFIKIQKEWKKSKSFSIKNSGYDIYFGLSSTALAQECEFEVDDGASKAKIKSAFVKSLKTKKLNKKVLGEFISLVA